jgi:hypothetical protein
MGTAWCPKGIDHDTAITTLVSCNPQHNVIHLGLGELLLLLAIIRCYLLSVTWTPEVGFGGEAALILDECYIYLITEIVCIHTFTSVWSHNNVVGVGSRLCAGPLRNCSIVAAKCPHWLWGIPTLLLCVYLVFLWGLVAGSWTTHLHRVLRLRVCGAIHPLLYLVMACTRQLYFYTRVLTLLNLKSLS